MLNSYENLQFWQIAQPLLYDAPANFLEDILGRQVGQREDMVCDKDGVDGSVGIDDDAVVGVGVHNQSVNLGVSLGVGIIVGSHPLTSLDS